MLLLFINNYNCFYSIAAKSLLILIPQFWCWAINEPWSKLPWKYQSVVAFNKYCFNASNPGDLKCLEERILFGEAKIEVTQWILAQKQTKLQMLTSSNHLWGSFNCIQIIICLCLMAAVLLSVMFLSVLLIRQAVSL